MGIALYESTSPYEQKIALVDTVTDTAFGPVMCMPDGIEDLYANVRDYAEAFLRWLPEDARRYSHKELERFQRTWELECQAKVRPAPDPVKAGVPTTCSKCGAIFEPLILCRACADLFLQPRTEWPGHGPERST